MEFNYRWNTSRAVENRGMASEIGGINDQYIIDQLQRLTASWYPGQPLYSGWVAPVDFEGSGERKGLADSVLTFDGNPTGAVSIACSTPEPLEEDSSTYDNYVDQAIPAPQLLPSAQYLAKLMNCILPLTPVATPAEKQKLKDEYFQYFRPGGGASARDHQRVDYSKMATDWNKTCALIESGQHKYVAINRKTAAHLQSYATSFKDRLNFLNTTAPVTVIGPVQLLSGRLRQQASADQLADSVASPRMPEPNRNGGAALPSAVVAVVAAAATAATAAAASSGVGVGASSGAGGGGSRAGPPPPSGRGAAGERGQNPQKKFRGCTECGHDRRAWAQHHPGNRCGAAECCMPDGQRRGHSEMKYSEKQKRRVFPPCEVEVCRRLYDSLRL